MPDYEVDLYGSKGSPSNFTVSVTADNAHRAKQLAVHQYGGKATYVRPVNWENPTIGEDDYEEVSYSSSGSSSSSGGFGGLVLVGAVIFGLFSVFSSDKDKQPQQIESAPIIVSQPVQQQQETVEQSNCRIWANANPSLADKLEPGDQCFGY